MHSDGIIMKSLFICASVILLVIVSGMAGCIANQNTSGTPQPVQSVTPTPETGTTQIPPGGTQENTSGCFIPSLIFNTSQQTTNVSWGFSFSNDNVSYMLPYGSIIYHTPDGITRVFDRNGTQMLIAHDSDSLSPTPGGQLPSTKVVQVPSGAFLQDDGNMTHILLNGSCIGTIVDTNSSSVGTPVPSLQICHCPMEPAVSTTGTPQSAPADGLCHCQ